MVSFEEIDDSDDEQTPTELDSDDEKSPVPIEPPAPPPVPDAAVPAKLPVRGETVEIRGLVSSPALNGKRAMVTSFVTKGKNSGRYKVEVRGDGETRTLAVKPANVSVLPPGGGADKDWETRNLMPNPKMDLVHVLVPCHVHDWRRGDQFEQCARSLARQKARCRIFVGVSGKGVLRRRAIDSLRAAATTEEGCWHQWTILDEDSGGEMVTEKSQFQHLKALFEQSQKACPNAWLAFLDNDDMFHPERINWFHECLGKMAKDYPNRKAFCCGSKALISEVRASSKYGIGKVFPLEQLLDGHDKLKGVVEVLTTAQENMKADTLEFFDFCVHPDIFKTFCELTPSEILDHQFCDCRYLNALTQITPPPPFLKHPTHTFMLMHYCIRQVDRNSLYASQNLEKLKISVTEEDKMMESLTEYSADKICSMRKGAEEVIVQTIHTTHEGFERSRDELIGSDYEHSTRVGNMLWRKTVEKFEAYFTKKLARKNEQWWKKLDSAVPEKVDKDGFVNKGNGVRVMKLN